MYQLLLLLPLVQGNVFEPRAVSISLKSYETSVDVIFLRGYPWNSVTDFTLTIYKGSNNGGDELCSQQPFTCDVSACNINSANYCDPLPTCTNVFVDVNGIGSDYASSTIKTLCGTPTTSTIEPTTTRTTIATTTPTFTTEKSTSTTYRPTTSTHSTIITSTSTLPSATTSTPSKTSKTTSILTTTTSTTESSSSSTTSVSTTTTEKGPGVPLSCFYCSDNDADYNYDPECGLNGYNGISDSSNTHHSCYVTVWNDGSKVFRAMTGASVEDGTCDDLDDRMACYCNTDDCNSDLCDHCFPDRTTSTQHPTQPTLPPVSTFPPGTGLECFACVGCQIVTDDTSTAVSQDYQSCFTSIIADGVTKEHLVIRGGDVVPHIDGDCRHEDGAFICYCSSNLCNQDPSK